MKYKTLLMTMAGMVLPSIIFWLSGKDIPLQRGLDLSFLFTFTLVTGGLAFVIAKATEKP